MTRSILRWGVWTRFMERVHEKQHVHATVNRMFCAGGAGGEARKEVPHGWRGGGLNGKAFWEKAIRTHRGGHSNENEGRGCPRRCPLGSTSAPAPAFLAHQQRQQVGRDHAGRASLCVGPPWPTGKALGRKCLQWQCFRRCITANSGYVYLQVFLAASPAQPLDAKEFIARAHLLVIAAPGCEVEGRGEIGRAEDQGEHNPYFAARSVRDALTPALAPGLSHV